MKQRYGWRLAIRRLPRLYAEALVMSYDDECQTLPHRVLLCGGKAKTLSRRSPPFSRKKYSEAKILYDKYHKTDPQTRRSVLLLQELYEEDRWARYVVVVLPRLQQEYRLVRLGMGRDPRTSNGPQRFGKSCLAGSKHASKLQGLNEYRRFYRASTT